MSTHSAAVAEPVPPIGQPNPEKPSKGLTSDEATTRLKTDGLNAMPDVSVRPIINLLSKFWAPIPWLLEASLILEVGLHKYFEAAIIAGLLIFNATLAFVQEGKAQATLKALRSRLALNASVLRDGKWQTLPATQLVRGDRVKLSLGAVVAADVHLLSGSVLLDQSMLTGESLPTEAGTGADTYAGALVRRGEATAEVTATGARTKFGRTAELVQTAHSISSQQTAVLQIVRNLAIFNGVVIVLMGIFAYSHSLPNGEIISLLLTSVLAAIPVGLPATFTLAAALGARALAKLGVLPTRLSAVDEAGTINVLCSDKTGTLTLNQLSVTTVRALSGSDEAHVLAMASLASSDGGSDAVDAAIRSASEKKLPPDLLKLSTFVPFDPAKKTSEATATNAKGEVIRIVKGAYTAVAGLTAPAPGAAAIANELEKKGFRVLAVAAGPPTAFEIIGLIALSDPPARNRIVDDRPGCPNPDADGHHHDHRRLPFHVPGDRQGSSFRDAKLMGDRQDHCCRSNPGAVLSGVLYGHSGRRQIRNALRNRYAQNPYGHCACLWQPVHHIRRSGPAPLLGSAADAMAGALDMCRHTVHLRLGEPWSRNGTVISRCFSNHPGSRRRVLDTPQHRQDSDLLEAETFLVA
jgi:H+-transporting ATPase